jgi:hypothetical protein
VFVRGERVVFVSDRSDVTSVTNRTISSSLLLTAGGRAVRFDEMKPRSARVQIADALRVQPAPAAQPRWVAD